MPPTARALALATTALLLLLLVPAASAKSPLVPAVSADPDNGTVCVIEQPAADAGTATCVQAYDPDCLVETTYETIGGPYTVCTVPRP